MLKGFERHHERRRDRARANFASAVFLTQDTVFVRASMVLRNANEWGLGAVTLTVVAMAAAGIMLLRRKKPTEEELERARRRFLVQSGRLVDGMLLDVAEVEAAEGRKLTMLIFNYRIGGVDYDCSQDVTALSAILDAQQVRAGFPCTVRYQPGNPQNSIVVDEQWSGLRAGLPMLPALKGAQPVDVSQLRPRRG